MYLANILNRGSAVKGCYFEANWPHMTEGQNIKQNNNGSLLP